MPLVGGFCNPRVRAFVVVALLRSEEGSYCRREVCLLLVFILGLAHVRAFNCLAFGLGVDEVLVNVFLITKRIDERY